MKKTANKGGWEGLRQKTKGLRQPILAQWNVKSADGWAKMSLSKEDMEAIIARQTKESQILRERENAEQVRANCTAHAFWHDCKSCEGRPGYLTV